MALWLVHADAAQVAAAEDHDAVFLAFSPVGDLSGAELLDEVRDWLGEAYPHAPSETIGVWAQGLWSFVHDVADGDLAAMPLPDQGPVRFGRVRGDYRYVEDAPPGRRHERPVRWLRDVERADLDPPLVQALRASNRQAPIARIVAGADAVEEQVGAAAADESHGMGRRKFLVGALGAATAAAAVGILRPWDSSSSPAVSKARPKDQLRGKLGGAGSSNSGSSIYADWVRTENAKAGTTNWTLSNGGTNQIEGYASAVSAVHGETLDLYVSCQAPTFTAEAYRMGYYQGNGARLVWQSVNLPGTNQPLPSKVPGTNTVTAGWTPSFQLPITTQFPPGVYLVKLQSSTGFQHHIPFTIRDDSSDAKYLVQNSVTSWQAYNQWGGYSLYYGLNGRGQDYANRARVVSFDRPYDKGDGSSDFLGLELPLIMLMESMGLDVTYTTDVDVHQNPSVLLQHKSYWSLGHDEYWSTEMRDGAEAARDAGVNLAFLGSNAAFRQIRFEPSLAGPNRLQVCYKDAAEDPMSRVNPALTTVNWREPPLNRPESLMIGQQYESNPVNADMVFVDPSAWMFQRTGVQAGSRIPIGVGSEYDRYYPSQQGPQNVQILAHSPLVCQGRSSFGDMTYYSALSGAGVFASGSIYWITKLTPASFPNSPYNAFAVAITKNVLQVFGAGPAGEKYPSVSNYEQIASGAGNGQQPTIPNSA